LNIIFDLDGTLLDAKLRLFMLFSHLVPSSTLSFDQYWDFKQNKINHQTILSKEFMYPPDAVAQFMKDWMALIESPKYLALDTEFHGIRETLAVLKRDARLYVCTARQHRQPAIQQLIDFGLLKFFDDVLVTEQNYSKVDLIKRAIPNITPLDWVIGDSGKDIETGKNLKIQTCAVLSGFLNRENLVKYDPNLILSSAVEFVVQRPSRT
jgi:phosphoglycolate phosphatase